VYYPVTILPSFLVSIPLGIASTIAIIMHELPQEIADVGVLLYAGWSKKKALLFNFLSALAALAGALVGYALKVDEAVMLPFAAGIFIYIAAASLVPELHRHCKAKETFFHVLAMVIGVALLAWLSVAF